MKGEKICPYCGDIQTYKLKENGKVICKQCRKELPKDKPNKWKTYTTIGAK